MIREEAATLSATFRRLLLLALAAPQGAQACSATRESSASPQADAAADAPSAQDAMVPDAGALSDGSPDCQPSAPYFIDAANVIFGDANCFYFVDYPCGATYPAIVPENSGCYVAPSDCASVCSLDAAAALECQYWVGCPDGSGPSGAPARIACGVCPGLGRRPAGLRRGPRGRAANAVGQYLAQASRLEAASVHAFERLGRELRAHRAPSELVRAAERSARDEVQHARVVGRLARRYGCEPHPARVGAHPVRTLGRMALENAVEGCVRETFGALVATWQEAHASDARVRVAMRRIAGDETRHAALAWAIARWAEPRLDRRAQRRVALAKRGAIDRLRREVSMPVHQAIARQLGLPDVASSLRLHEQMVGTIWAQPRLPSSRAVGNAEYASVQTPPVDG